MKDKTLLPSYLAQGAKARLIPVCKDSNKEQKATSVLLAVVQSVEEFGKESLNSVGASVGKTSKIECYTEIVLKGEEKSKGNRPDGLIVVKTGSREWKALVEAKVGNNELSPQQVEGYVDLARKHGVDAVITISNQAATLLTHHPVAISKGKLKKVGLYHWSWSFLLAEAILWEKHKGLSDPDQAYILSELVRYLQHDSSGVLGTRTLKSGWKEICQKIQVGGTVNKNSADAREAVESWHQLCRDVALDLSLDIGRTVPVYLSRKHSKDQNARLQDDVEQLISANTLECELDVPEAASKLKITADFLRKSVTCSMCLRAPEDKATTRGKIGWLLRQLKQTEGKASTYIRASWPSRMPDTQARLVELEEQGFEVLDNNNSNAQPIAFEIFQTTDLAAKFKGVKVFPEEFAKMVPMFYESVGQFLVPWQPKAPKVIDKASEQTSHYE